ncbi:XdhC family protein [Pantoea coffeiphila]
MSMYSPDIRVLEFALSEAGQHRDLWLCTVLNTWGSSPRSPGALMAVSQTNTSCGSLSGGCIEEHFMQRLAQGAYRNPSQLVRYGAGSDIPEISLPCGGSLEVLVEYLPATAETLDYLHRMLLALLGEFPQEKTLEPGEPAILTPCPHPPPGPVVHLQDTTLRLRLAPPVQIIIAGLSPVAEYCIEFARAVGFTVLVCEHREAMRATFSSHKTRPDFPARYLERHGCGPNSAVLCLTHDARIDDLTLMEACRTPAFYIGALGSRRNSEKRLERLRKVADLDEAQLARIRGPVGLAIGSKTPAEIALAIIADIVRVKNGVGVSCER